METRELELILSVSDDFIGELLAWTSLAPLVIVAGFGTLILFRRDLHTVRLNTALLATF